MRRHALPGLAGHHGGQGSNHRPRRRVRRHARAWAASAPRRVELGHLAEHGYIAIVPNLFERFGHGTRDDVAAAVRGAGGLSDASVIADGEAALGWVKSHP